MTTVRHAPPHERHHVRRGPQHRSETNPLGTPGPLLILGPARSSQSLVALALAQHSRCELVLDASWLPRLGEAFVGVHRLATRLGERSAVGEAVSPSDFIMAAGTASTELLAPDTPWILGTPARTWVTSGAVERLRDVVLLAEMFPDSRIVHVVRHPDAVVESLTIKACGDGRYVSRPAGYRLWRAATEALVDAEHAYGTERIVRISAGDLQADPVATLSRCLALVGLRFDPLCAAAVKEIIADLEPAAGDEPARAGAIELFDELTASAGRRHPGDPLARARLWDDVIAGDHEPPDLDAQKRYQRFVQLAVPEGAVAAVISKGDPSLLDVPGRRCRHLSRGAADDYLGYHPADGAEALDRLTRAIDDDAAYLVVPGASRWWLEHYPALDVHLQQHARVVAHHEDIATVYELPTEADHG